MFATASNTVTLIASLSAYVLITKVIIFYRTVVSQFAGNQGGLNNFLVLASVHVIVMSVWILLVSYLLIFSVSRANPLMLKKYVNISGGVLLVFFSLYNF